MRKKVASKPEETQLECSIGRGPINIPVALRCGHVFERDNIEGWSKRSNTCPDCRDSFSKNDIQVNRLVQKFLAEGSVDVSYDQLYPFIRQWHLITDTEAASKDFELMGKLLLLASVALQLYFYAILNSFTRFVSIDRALLPESFLDSLRAGLKVEKRWKSLMKYEGGAVIQKYPKPDWINIFRPNVVEKVSEYQPTGFFRRMELVHQVATYSYQYIHRHSGKLSFQQVAAYPYWFNHDSNKLSVQLVENPGGKFNFFNTDRSFNGLNRRLVFELSFFGQNNQKREIDCFAELGEVNTYFPEQTLLLQMMVVGLICVQKAWQSVSSWILRDLNKLEPLKNKLLDGEKLSMNEQSFVEGLAEWGKVRAGIVEVLPFLLANVLVGLFCSGRFKVGYSVDVSTTSRPEEMLSVSWGKELRGVAAVADVDTGAIIVQYLSLLVAVASMFVPLAFLIQLGADKLFPKTN